jgi:Flp pilus assembly pilin Flp
MKKMIRHFVRSERGATAVEYVILVGAIAGVISVAAYGLGDEIKKLFTVNLDGTE